MKLGGEESLEILDIVEVWYCVILSDSSNLKVRGKEH
jgi:hypothetical protein